VRPVCPCPSGNYPGRSEHTGKDVLLIWVIDEASLPPWSWVSVIFGVNLGLSISVIDVISPGGLLTPSLERTSRHKSDERKAGMADDDSEFKSHVLSFPFVEYLKAK
jgi:hypothetical protein